MRNISSDQAIDKAHARVNLPSIIIGLLSLVISATTILYSSLPNWYLVFVLPLAFIAQRIYWKIAIRSWKKWAKKNVNDLVDLQYRALEEKLIKKEDNFFLN
ncbi:MAG TPA: hypothetical protein VK027_01430 [Chitinophagaceae bacterium]|nr:hypothetical protein [Chitinophagaceae bacterium]